MLPACDICFPGSHIQDCQGNILHQTGNICHREISHSGVNKTQEVLDKGNVDDSALPVDGEYSVISCPWPLLGATDASACSSLNGLILILPTFAIHEREGTQTVGIVVRRYSVRRRIRHHYKFDGKQFRTAEIVKYGIHHMNGGSSASRGHPEVSSPVRAHPRPVVEKLDLQHLVRARVDQTELRPGLARVGLVQVRPNLSKARVVQVALEAEEAVALHAVSLAVRCVARPHEEFEAHGPRGDLRRGAARLHRVVLRAG